MIENFYGFLDNSSGSVKQVSTLRQINHFFQKSTDELQHILHELYVKATEYYNPEKLNDPSLVAETKKVENFFYSRDMETQISNNEELSIIKETRTSYFDFLDKLYDYLEKTLGKETFKCTDEKFHAICIDQNNKRAIELKK